MRELNTTRDLRSRIVAVLRSSGELTTGELRAHVGGDPVTISNALASLANAGDVEMVGRTGRQRVWRATASVAKGGAA